MSSPGLAASLRPVSFADLPGWQDDAHSAAFAAFRRGCGALSPGASDPTAAALRGICLAAIGRPEAIDDRSARAFFEANFIPHRLDGDPQGLFTGYYEPVIAAARSASADYAVPILGPPMGLVPLAGRADRASLPAGTSHAILRNGRLSLAPTRAEINRGALAGSAEALAWLADPIDAFFLHVQGSGRLVYPDGSTERVSFAGKNGHPYTSIGARLVARGVMSREAVSMESLRAYLAADRERGAALMEENESYIFFRRVPNDAPGLGPIGQLEVPLTPGRSLAVDRDHYSGNLPIWLETTLPATATGPGGSWRRLMVAQDTGSAIRGPARGDIFFGSGPAAGALAGRMRAPGRMAVLLPRCLEC